MKQSKTSTPQLSNAERCKAYYEGNKDKWYARHIKNRYGITTEDYADMLARQDGRCAICRRGDPGGKGKWHVDHCHASGEVRGLLCHSCNTSLGHFHDDITILYNAIDYLKAHNG